MFCCFALEPALREGRSSRWSEKAACALLSVDCDLGSGPNCPNRMDDEIIFNSIDPNNNRFNQSLFGTSGSGEARQDSSFTPLVVDVMTFADAPQQFLEFGSRNATSSFEFVFDLSQNVLFQLTGTVDEEFIGVQDPVALVSLSGPNTNLQFSDDDVFDVSGTLEAGRYTFLVESSASSSVIEFSSATANAILTIPEPGSSWLLFVGGSLLLLGRRRLA